MRRLPVGGAWMAAATLALMAPAVAAADSRVTATIEGPAAAKRGQEVTYTVTVRNAGPRTLGQGGPRLQVDLDALPGDGATRTADARQVGGTGPWACTGSVCTLAPGVQLPAGATASFGFPMRIRRSLTLDVDVRGRDVDFANARKRVRVAGVLRPVAFGLSVRGGGVSFTLSEPARVSMRLERLGRRYRVGGRARCAGRRPRGAKGRLKGDCVLATRRLAVVAGVRGVNRVTLPSLSRGGRYRVRLEPVTADRRYGREALSRPFRTIVNGGGRTAGARARPTA